MLKVTLITVGKVKEQYLRDGIAEYSKRLGRYCKLEILDVKDEKTPDGASDVVETQIKKKEADRIMALIPDDSYVLSLAIEGKQFDSVEFADKIDKLPGRGVSHLVFVIGGSLGLHDIIKKRSDYPFHDGWRQSFTRSHAHGAKLVSVAFNVPVKRLSVNTGLVSQFLSCHCLHALSFFL